MFSLIFVAPSEVRAAAAGTEAQGPEADGVRLRQRGHQQRD